jgi:hypothetical protein
MKGPLETQWLEALEAVVAALEAAARAGAMPVAETSKRRRLLAVERAWVETFNWSAMDQDPGTIVALALPRPATENVVEKAA